MKMIEQILIEGVGEVTLEWIIENEKKVVKQYVVVRANKLYDLLSYVPAGFEVRLNRRYLGPNTKEEPIQIGVPDSAYYVAVALHEIGHARRYLDTAYDSQRYNLTSYMAESSDPKLTLELINEYMDEEYGPWEFSLQVLRTMQLSEETMRLIYWKLNQGLNSHLAGFLTLSALTIAAINAGTTSDKIRDQILRKREEWIKRVIGDYDLPAEYIESRGKGITVTI